MRTSISTRYENGAHEGGPENQVKINSGGRSGSIRGQPCPRRTRYTFKVQGCYSRRPCFVGLFRLGHRLAYHRSVAQGWLSIPICGLIARGKLTVRLTAVPA